MFNEAILHEGARSLISSSLCKEQNRLPPLNSTFSPSGDIYIGARIWNIKMLCFAAHHLAFAAKTPYVTVSRLAKSLFQQITNSYIRILVQGIGVSSPINMIQLYNPAQEVDASAANQFEFAGIKHVLRDFNCRIRNT